MRALYLTLFLVSTIVCSGKNKTIFFNNTAEIAKVITNTKEGTIILDTGVYVLKEPIKISSSITLIGGGSKTILVPNKNEAAIIVHNVKNATIKNLSIKGCKRGSAIKVLNSSIMMFNCKISDNLVENGALFIDMHSTGYFDYCIFYNNKTSGKYGGGVFIEEGDNKFVFRNCSFMKNSSKEGGSAIYGGGNISIIGTDICSNITEKEDTSAKALYFHGKNSQIFIGDQSVVAGNVCGTERLMEVKGIKSESGYKKTPLTYIDLKPSQGKDDVNMLLDGDDIKSIPQDLIMPTLMEGNPQAGKMVKMQLSNYKSTKIYHTLYLPKNWVAGEKYPIIVSYPGNGVYFNRYGDFSRGLPESNPMGYGISGGEDFICLGLGYIDTRNNKITEQWWGDVQANVDYCLKAIDVVCNEYGGDLNNIILTGFSRSSIGMGFIHRSNDTIASIWKAFIGYDHFDQDAQTNNNWYRYPTISYNYNPEINGQEALEKRISRIGKTPYLHIGYVKDFDKISALCAKHDINITFIDKTHRNHNASWTLRATEEREFTRKWLKEVLGL